ncbi:glycosyltransferase family 4 protein [Pseudarthrobacter sp. PH31-O2]|uniref:glycosyltransferase family 4 protein n=1 Tax=Pseudarthrobacter sp. PH31-O2 TaxID=3046206 RepID=UPI0024BA21CC|nr:glycosyltransferase family 4 protein [Pseudarthrobacter sp. PH31-O2]MDJ0351357.1 glycosyltransferase family 4 protein [Pseudarthrobacter sp. PH31-O2]
MTADTSGPPTEAGTSDLRSPSMIQLLRNARLAANTALQHFTDDPIVLFLQVSRRFPAAIVQSTARLVGAAARENSVAILVLLASMTRGDGEDVARRLQLAADQNVTGKRSRRLADIALAANLPEVSDVLLAGARDSRGLKSALARRQWYDGAVSDAVAALDGSGWLGRQQQMRLAGELAVFQGVVPSLGRREYTPLRGRVLHLLTNSLPHTESGYAQRSHSIMVAQQEEGWDVLAVTRIGYPVQIGKLSAASIDVVDGVRYRRLLPARLAAKLDARLQQQAEELLRLALEFRPSVLHTTTHFVNGLVVRAVAEALDIPWVYEVRGQLADTWASTRGPAARESEKYRLFQQREAELMAAADLVVTLGEVMKDNIVAAGIPNERIIITPNAIGGQFLEEPVEPSAARRELGLPEQGQYIGTVSSLVPYEGIDDLIAAFGLLAPSNPDLRLLIVGDGASLPSLKQLARRSGFDDRIIFTGRVPRDKARLFHQALDVFVVPRRDLDVTRSVTPLKPVEALACARPVVASRLEALQEIVTDGTNGLLAAAGDPRDLAAKLEWLLDSEEFRARLGQAGRQGVLESRTWRANALSLAGAYEHLLEARL